MSTLWTEAIEEVYRLYGDGDSDGQVMPEHLYTWSIESPGWNLDERYDDGSKMEYSLLSFFQREPLHGWDSYYVYCAYALARLNKQTLYVGCGTGRFLQFLTDKGIENYGIDISDRALTLLGQRGVTNCEKMDGCAMTFADDSHPLVYLPRDVINWSTDVDAMIDEACRVASETVLIGSDRHGDNSKINPTGHEVTMEWLDKSASCIFTGYPWEYFQARLAANGFKVESVMDHYGYWLMTASAI